MDFHEKGPGVIDIYFVERKGAVKKLDGVSKAVTTVGTITVATGNEDGLIGFVLDPEFASNNTMYFMYSFFGNGESTYRISQMKLIGANLDMASEKILLKINSARDKWHTAGAMNFDAYGDLWITIGDNETTEAGPGNVGDLRGGIIRITPDDSERGYSIPNGNFGAHMAEKFRLEGRTELAAQYLDTSLVKPEIYVKGTRNAYTMQLDPVRRWVAWGDVGPDYQKLSDEYNLVKEPQYAGWPYFAGQVDISNENAPYFAAGDVPGGMLKTGPINTLASVKVKQLPPVFEPLLVHKHSACAITGPIFRIMVLIRMGLNFPRNFIENGWFRTALIPIPTGFIF
jgi:cytochrome c